MSGKGTNANQTFSNVRSKGSYIKNVMKNLEYFRKFLIKKYLIIVLL